MAAAKKITLEEFQSLNVKLIDELGGRYHCRGGVKDKVDFYGIAYVDPLQSGVILGQITGPMKNFASFKISRIAGEIQYTINPLPGNKASLDILENQVRSAIKRLHKGVTSEKYSGPMDKSNWKGFYMQRCRGNTVGPSELQGIELALSMNEIDLSFKQLCLSKAIFFKHY
jgi:hypothetical protein